MSTKDLLLLIKNLSKAEKKNFVVHSKKQGGTPHYLVLYYELQRLADEWEPRQGAPVFDEAVLERRLKLKKIKGGLQSLKNYLAQMIFRSLRLLYEKSCERDVIEATMKDARILEKRGLLALASERLQQASALAMQYEYFPLAVDAMVGLLQIDSQLDTRSYADSIEERVSDLGHAAACLQNYTEHYAWYHRAVLQFRLHAAAGAAPEFRPIGPAEPPPTFLSEVFGQQARALVAILHGNSEEARMFSQRSLELWRRHDHMKAERRSQYIRQTSNFLSFCIVQRAFGPFMEYLNELKTLLDSGDCSFDDAAELTQNILLAEQLFYLNTDRLEEACALHLRIEQALKTYGAKINKARELSLRFNTLVAFYAMGDYEHALKRCAEVIQLRRDQVQRRDLQLLAKVLRIIIHYELRDHQYLDTLVRSLGRLPRQGAGYDFERIILRNLLKLAEIQVSNRPDAGSATRTALDNFHGELLACAERQNRGYRIGFEEIMIWVRSKRDGKSFREILREHNTG